jgi:hypothetical protein
MTADPYAHLRHLDSQLVTVRTTEFVEDVDGNPAGVYVEEIPPTPLTLPALPGDDDDDDGDDDDE